jgi:glutamate-1-semialdehyde 2,1-aminomutase
MSTTIPRQGSVLADLSEEFKRRFPESARLHAQLARHLPAGETRSVSYYPPFPLTIERGRGALIVDADGNEYVDVLNNYTSLIHGHAFSPIVEALAARIPLGTAFPAPSRHQLELAELLTSRYPAIERVRFTNSGTEAAMLALRIARRATGRLRLVTFKDGYHGTAPEFSEPAADTLILPYNDPDRLTAELDDRVAAVFVEPFLGTGVIPATDEFLRAIERTAHQVGAVFVLDEVQALRNDFAGTHGQLGLHPDLVLMGKIIGGGLPVGAVGGRAELLDLTAGSRADRLPHSGTFNGNPLTMVAGLQSLLHFDQAAIDRLNRVASSMAGRIERSGKERGLPVRVTRAGSIMEVHIDGRPEIIDPARRALHLSLLLSGVFAAPRGMLNLSTVMTDELVERVIEAYAHAFDRLRQSDLQ